MARIRTVKPKFWDDIKLSRISRDARLTFIGMWNFADDLGVLVAEPAWIKSKIYPYDNVSFEALESWVGELLNEKFVEKFEYKTENFLFIPNFLKHQKINRPNHSELLIPHKLLIKTLKHSLINHGSITDKSLTDQCRKGEDSNSKGKESMESNLWTTEKEKFFGAGDWIFKFCRDKNLTVDQFDAAAKKFISDLELKEDYKDVKELKRHFTNWFNKNKSVTPTGTEQTPQLSSFMKKLKVT